MTFFAEYRIQQSNWILLIPGKSAEIWKIGKPRQVDQNTGTKFIFRGLGAGGPKRGENLQTETGDQNGGCKKIE